MQCTKGMKLLERSTVKEPLDGSLDNSFWWKQSDGTGARNYQNEMTRKNHHDLWSKQHKANRRETARAIVDTLDRPSLRGRAFVDTLDTPFLRGRAFVDALGNLGDARGRAFVDILENPGLRGRAFVDA